MGCVIMVLFCFFGLSCMTVLQGPLCCYMEMSICRIIVMYNFFYVVLSSEIVWSELVSSEDKNVALGKFSPSGNLKFTI